MTTTNLAQLSAEMIKVWEGNTPISSILSYPYGSIGSVPSGKTRKARRAELNRIKAESFAQLGALYYTYPELTKEHLADWDINYFRRSHVPQIKNPTANAVALYESRFNTKVPGEALRTFGKSLNQMLRRAVRTGVKVPNLAGMADSDLM